MESEQPVAYWWVHVEKFPKKKKAVYRDDELDLVELLRLVELSVSHVVQAWRASSH